MAGINWTSSSIQSFFKTSLNQSNTGMNNLYSLLGDKALIKSGSYHKLMDAYVKKVKTDSAEASKDKDKTDNTNKKETKSSTYSKTGLKSDSVATDSIIDKLI